MARKAMAPGRQQKAVTRSKKSIKESANSSKAMAFTRLIESKPKESLDTLPTEVFRMVLAHLPALDVLSVKFVSKGAYLRTKYSDGPEIVDLRAGVKHRSYSEFMIKLEAEDLQCRTLQRLTCQSCGEQKSNDCNGFHDVEFKQDHLMRWCIQCTHEYYWLPATFKVRGEKMFFCEFNSCVRPLEQKVRPSDMLLMACSIQISLNDPLNKNKFKAAELQFLRYESNMCVHCLRSCMKRLRTWPSLNSGRYTASVEAFVCHQEMLEKSLAHCSDLCL